MNCKVHFAGYDNDPRAISVLRSVGVGYRLFTAYPFIEKPKDSYMVEKGIYETRAGFRHVIIDSGLFTLMFGAKKGGNLTTQDLRNWMHRIVRFANDNHLNGGCSFVECDCQKLAGPEVAWELRKEMRELMEGREIINVFHLEDGPDGFDKLVDFGDYIAISVPELRFNKGGQYKQITATLARRARMLKPSIKIHLLGCTEVGMLKENSFVTSSDSSSWTSSARFGKIEKRHVSQLKDDVLQAADTHVRQTANYLGFPVPPYTPKRMRYNGANYVSAKTEKAKYTRACGPQD